MLYNVHLYDELHEKLLRLSYFDGKVLVYSFCLISIGLQNLQSSLTFCHPVILQFLIAAIFFVNDCKELKLLI